MEVDHFDSGQKRAYHQNYANLFLAKGACNRKKQDRPRVVERATGLRFLNCCEEMDYNSVIFEDPKSHEVWGTNPVARYHIRYLGLNASNLVAERRERSELSTLLRNTRFLQKKKPDKTLVTLIQQLVETLDKHIPQIELREKVKGSATAP